MSEAFNWSELSEFDIAVAEQPAIAIHTNESGDCVIRQMGERFGEDLLIIVPRQHLQAFIDCINNFASAKADSGTGADRETNSSDRFGLPICSIDATALANAGATLAEIAEALGDKALAHS